MSQITDIQSVPILKSATIENASVPQTSAVGKQKSDGNVLPITGENQPRPSAGSPTAEMVDRAAVQINDYLQSQNRTLQFSVDKTTGQSIIKVVDQATGKVLRQIPAEYMVRLAQSLLEEEAMTSTGIKLST